MELKEVFEPVLNFIKNFQKKDKEITSKQAAKDRLKLVLMQDRASVSPDFFEMMKQEIIDVIKKYIEIDEESLEVELTRGMEVGLEGPALYANIPIKNVKPVAPKNGEESDEGYLGMSEEKAEEVAEQLLNHAEELLNKVKEENAEKLEEQPKEENEIEKNDEKIEEKSNKEVEEKVEDKKEEKKVAEKKTTKTATKTTKKTTTQKTTESKAKKETKK